MEGFKNIFIESTSKTPQVDFNQFTGELILSGRSIPENAARLYEPLIAWASEYIKSPGKTTNLRLNLEYFNSASTIWIAKMVRLLSKIDRDDHVLMLHIYFDIEDFDDMDEDELKEIIIALVDKISDTKVSIGIKTYGTDSDGKIVRESTILF